MVVKFEDGKMKVKTEYNPYFVGRAKELDGKWLYRGRYGAGKTA